MNEAQRLKIDGRWFWYIEGRLLPVVRGGDGPDDEGEPDPGTTITIPAEPTPEPTPPKDPITGRRVYTEEEVEQFRKQEKDKLYAQQQKLQEQLAALQKAEEDRQAEIEAQRKAAEKSAKEAEAAQKKKEEAEMEAKDLIERQRQEWEAKFSSLQDEIARRDAILEQERAWTELQLYAQQQLAEYEDQIAPQLRDFVQGSSKEEIDASIALVVQKTADILAEVTQQNQTQRQQQVGTRPTGFTPAGPMDTGQGVETLSADQLRNMSMSEWSKMRGRILRGGAQAKGMFE